MRSSERTPFSREGVTLVELMVMSVIASLVAITVIQGFSGISKGIIASRFKSLGTQLASEKMQILKSTPYYRLRVSSQTVVPSGLGALSPAVQSDDFNHPPTVSIVNGITFTAYTSVQRVIKAVDESLQLVSWNNPDSGLKQITVDVVWRERNALRRTRLVNLLENPSRLVSNGVFVGQTWGGTSTLANVRIETLEDPSLKALSDAGGNYRLEAPVGTYTLRASKRGYFPETIANRTITGIAPQTTVNFNNLQVMSSGTISGTVWHNDHLVISRIVGDSGGYEYVEIFNPTTWTWTVDGQIGLTFQRDVARDPVPIPIAMDYSVGAVSIGPGGFFLFGNENDVTLSVDAQWDRTVSGGACNIAAVINDSCFPNFDVAGGTYDVIPHYSADDPTAGVGVLTLYNRGTGAILDRVGWRGGGGLVPAASETVPIAGVQGMTPNTIYFRKSTPAGGFSSAVGPAYDSGNNSVDWETIVDPTALTKARKGLSAPLPIQSGTPSQGAFVFANDGLSQLVVASLGGSPPEARFTLPKVATGTWTVNASTGNYFLSFTTAVAHAVNVSTSLVLNTPAQYGFLSGYVRDTGNQIIPNIYVNPGNGLSDATGFYRIPALPGGQTITTNPNQENPNLYELRTMVGVDRAKEKTYNINLNIAGKISGWVMADGTTPLPGIPVKAVDQWGDISAVTTSGTDGTFVLKTGQGPFSVEPMAAAGEKVVPPTQIATISGANPTVSVGTFTVSSSLGALAGAVTSQGKPITTGVYIIASTGTVPVNPPVIDLGFRQSGSVYSSGSSRSDGTYSLPLTPGIYNVAAWYTTLNGNTPTVVRKDFLNIVVTANQKTTLNLPW